MTFRGWPTQALEFFQGLEADNSKTYWTTHRQTYEQHVAGPMTELLSELRGEFGEGKLYRPYRDTRFSADKSPYRTHVAATLETGGYIQFSATGLACGSGMWMLAADQLDRYRRAVDDDVTGEELRRVVNSIVQSGIAIVDRNSLKTTPRGYPRDHPRADLLRHNGLASWKEWPVAKWLGTSGARSRVLEVLRASRPLNDWLAGNVGPSEIPPRGRSLDAGHRPSR